MATLTVRAAYKSGSAPGRDLPLSAAVRARPGNARHGGHKTRTRPKNCKIIGKVKKKKKNVFEKKNFQSKRRPRMLRTGPLKDEAAVLLSALCGECARPGAADGWRTSTSAPADRTDGAANL